MARCRSSTSRPRRPTSRSRWTRPATRSPTRTRCSSRPTSSSAGRARPGSSSPAGSCSRTASRACPAAARSSTSTTVEHVYHPDIEHREEGGTPAIVESIRAGLVFQLKATVGTDAIRERETSFIDRALTQWEANPVDRDPRLARGGAAVDRVVRRPPPGPLPPPQLRGGGAQRPVRDPVARRLLVCRAVRARPAGDRPRDEPRSSSARSPAAARGSSPAGSGSTSTTSSARRCSRSSSTRSTSSRARAGGCCPSTGSIPRPGCGATAPATPSRRSASTTSRYADGRMAYPAHRHREPESRLADYLAEARTLLARPPLPLAGPTFDAGRRGPGLRGPALVPAPRGRVERGGRSGRDAVVGRRLVTTPA